MEAPPNDRTRRMTALVLALVLTVGIAVAVLIAQDVGPFGEDEAEEAVAALPNGCERVEAPAPKDVELQEPKEQVKPGEEITASVDTSCGSFEFALDTKESPKTASSFVHMVSEGLYDDTSFHRVVDGFVIQGGDPAGDGTGGPGYSVTEPPPPDTIYSFGTVAMAKGGAEPHGTSGSQFFVVTAPADAGLPPDYAVLGELTAGEDTVKKIESLADPQVPDGPPTDPVVINTITLSE